MAKKSKDLTLGGLKLPSYLSNAPELAESADDLDTGGSGVLDLPRISLKGFKFSIVAPGGEVIQKNKGPAHVVILGAAPRGKVASKVYYEGDYDESNPLPPDCSSVDGVRPDSWIEHPVSDTCAKCPMNAWGSGKGRGKACRDKKLLFVVAPDAIADGQIIQLQVPPASLKAMSKFARELKKHRVPLQAVVVELDFDEEYDYPVLTFKVAGFLSEEDYEAAAARQVEVETLIDEYLGQAPAADEPGDDEPEDDEPGDDEPGDDEPPKSPRVRRTASDKKGSSRRRGKSDEAKTALAGEDSELASVLKQWGR